MQPPHSIQCLNGCSCQFGSLNLDVKLDVRILVTLPKVCSLNSAVNDLPHRRSTPYNLAQSSVIYEANLH